MSTAELARFLEVYVRMGNAEAVAALRKELEKRDPKHPSLVRFGGAAAEAEPAEEVNPADIAAETQDDEATRAETLVRGGKHAKAASVLAKLKRKSFAGQPFPHQQDLAYALLESGQKDKARDAFSELASSQTAAADQRADARARLKDLAVSDLISRASKAIKKEKGEDAVKLTSQLQALLPKDDLAAAMHAEALTVANRDQEAYAILRKLKAKYGGRPFPYQQAYAYSLYKVQGVGVARSEFRQMADGAYSDEIRKDAESWLTDNQAEGTIKTIDDALRRKDMKLAHYLSKQMLVTEPVTEDAYETRAKVQKAGGDRRGAARTLEAMRDRFYGSKPFPSSMDLAELHLQGQDFDASADALRAALRSPAVSGVRRSSIEEALDHVSDIKDASARTSIDAFDEEEGSMIRTGLKLQSSLQASNQFFARTSYDAGSLSDERIIGEDSINRIEGEVGYRRMLGEGLFAGISVGGSENEILYGAETGMLQTGKFGWRLGLAGNERATDSLQLEALDGRQNAIHLDVSTYSSSGVFFDFRLYGRTVDMEEASLGEGLGAEISIGRTLFENTGGPQLSVSYAGDVSVFNHDTLGSDVNTRLGVDPLEDLGGSLIEEAINRHMLMLSLGYDFSDDVSGYVAGGAGYEFEDREIVYQVGGGLDWRLNERARFSAALDYDSSGSAGNSGAGVIFGSVALKIRF